VMLTVSWLVPSLKCGECDVAYQLMSARHWPTTMRLDNAVICQVKQRSGLK